MKSAKRRILLALLLITLLVMSGCAQEEDNQQDSVSLVIKDMSGAEISLEGPAERIVALTAADCEIIYALGAGDSLVGRGEYCDYPEEVLDVAVVQSGSNTNIEEIIALEPQVVIMSMMAQTNEQIEALKNAGIKVVISDAQDIEGVYTAIELIGKVVGKDEQAEQLIAEMKNEIAEISEKVEGLEKDKTVYFEVSPLEYGLWTAGNGTFIDELSNILGVHNIFTDVNGWAEISQEQIIQRNPDYIVSVVMYFGEDQRPEDEILARAGWQEITAVKNKDVLLADSDAISRPGPRLIEALSNLYDFFYHD